MADIGNYLNLGPLVMVVDDDPVSRKFLQVSLKRSGYGSIVCDSGVEALNLLYEYAPIVAICDYDMPEMNGIDFFLQARTLKPYLRGILHSGAVDYAVLTDAVEGGFDDCLLKPIRPKELYASLQRSTMMAKHWRSRYEELGDGSSSRDGARSGVPGVPGSPA